MNKTVKRKLIGISALLTGLSVAGYQLYITLSALMLNNINLINSIN